MAHTCKPGADDEMFAVNRPGPGNLYIPAYDLCMEADGTGSPAQLYLRACSDSTLQRFEFDSDGRFALSDSGLCMAVSPEDGEPTGGPSHLRRDLSHARLRRDRTRPEPVDLPGALARMTNGGTGCVTR